MDQRRQLQNEIYQQYKIVCGKDPEYPSYIEVLDADLSIPVLFFDQECCDQETADHKKDIHTEIAVQ